MTEITPLERTRLVCRSHRRRGSVLGSGSSVRLL